MSANYESQPDQQQYESAIQENSYIDRASADPGKSQQQSSERIDNEYPQHQDEFHHDSSQHETQLKDNREVSSPINNHNVDSNRPNHYQNSEERGDYQYSRRFNDAHLKQPSHEAPFRRHINPNRSRENMEDEPERYQKWRGCLGFGGVGWLGGCE